jgi:hypothetical protein
MVAGSFFAEASGIKLLVLDPTALQAAILTSVVAIWTLAYAALVATSRGRRYLAEPASKSLTQDNIDSRMDSLTIAGLVLAGLAVGPASTSDMAAATMLVSSLGAFMVAWAAGFFPDRISSTVVRDGMHWIGLSALLGGVHAIARAVIATSGPGVLVTVLASGMVASYAALHAWAHLRGAFVAGPRETPAETVREG